MTSIHFVLPVGVDDPARPSGGNTYDRRVSDGLAAAGWDVREHFVAGAWPTPDRVALESLARALGPVPTDAVVLVDGLIGSAAPDVLVPLAADCRLVLLVHMPLGETDRSARAAEGAVLAAARAVITTSAWTRQRLLDCYGLEPDRVHVAHPGTDAAHASTGTATGGELLCVAAVAEHKGHDLLVEALGSVADLSWRCRCVGSLDRDPAFVATLRLRIAERGLQDRVELVGPRFGAELERWYATSDLLVLASRGETYGMVVAEALAHGVPVLATAVGGVHEALGGADDGAPGLLVPPDSGAAFAGGLRRWLVEPELRARLRAAAMARRPALPRWTDTVERVAAVLTAAGAPIR